MKVLNSIFLLSVLAKTASSNPTQNLASYGFVNTEVDTGGRTTDQEKTYCAAIGDQTNELLQSTASTSFMFLPRGATDTRGTAYFSGHTDKRSAYDSPGDFLNADGVGPSDDEKKLIEAYLGYQSFCHDSHWGDKWNGAATSHALGKPVETLEECADFCEEYGNGCRGFSVDTRDNIVGQSNKRRCVLCLDHKTTTTYTHYHFPGYVHYRRYFQSALNQFDYISSPILPKDKCLTLKQDSFQQPSVPAIVEKWIKDVQGSDYWYGDYTVNPADPENKWSPRIIFRDEAATGKALTIYNLMHSEKAFSEATCSDVFCLQLCLDSNYDSIQWDNTCKGTCSSGEKRTSESECQNCDTVLASRVSHKSSTNLVAIFGDPSVSQTYCAANEVVDGLSLELISQNDKPSGCVRELTDGAVTKVYFNEKITSESCSGGQYECVIAKPKNVYERVAGLPTNNNLDACECRRLATYASPYKGDISTNPSTNFIETDMYMEHYDKTVPHGCYSREEIDNGVRIVVYSYNHDSSSTVECSNDYVCLEETSSVANLAEDTTRSDDNSPSAVICSQHVNFEGSMYEENNAQYPYGCFELADGKVYFNGAKTGTPTCSDANTNHATKCVSDPSDTCQPGYYKTPSGCALCDSGSVTDTLNQIGARTCTVCPDGTYNTESTTPCISWSVTPQDCFDAINEDGQTGNRYTPGSKTTDATCTPCLSGYTAPQSTSNMDPTTCTLCSGGYGSDGNGTCIQCIDGHFQVHGSLSSEPCAPKECPVGQGVTDDIDKINDCELCTTDTFSDSPTTGQCESCSGNKYTANGSGQYTAMGASQCMNCPAGKQQSLVGGECELCPVDQSSASGSECTTCPENTYAADNSGSYVTEGAVQCAPCPVGKVNVDGGECDIHDSLPGISFTTVNIEKNTLSTLNKERCYKLSGIANSALHATEETTDESGNLLTLKYIERGEAYCGYGATPWIDRYDAAPVLQSTDLEDQKTECAAICDADNTCNGYAIHKTHRTCTKCDGELYVSDWISMEECKQYATAQSLPFRELGSSLLPLGCSKTILPQEGAGDAVTVLYNVHQELTAKPSWKDFRRDLVRLWDGREGCWVKNQNSGGTVNWPDGDRIKYASCDKLLSILDPYGRNQAGNSEEIFQGVVDNGQGYDNMPLETVQKVYMPPSASSVATDCSNTHGDNVCITRADIPHEMKWTSHSDYHAFGRLTWDRVLKGVATKTTMSPFKSGCTLTTLDGKGIVLFNEVASPISYSADSQLLVDCLKFNEITNECEYCLTGQHIDDDKTCTLCEDPLAIDDDVSGGYEFGDETISKPYCEQYAGTVGKPFAFTSQVLWYDRPSGCYEESGTIYYNLYSYSETTCRTEYKCIARKQEIPGDLKGLSADQTIRFRTKISGAPIPITECQCKSHAIRHSGMTHKNNFEALDVFRQIYDETAPSGCIIYRDNSIWKFRFNKDSNNIQCSEDIRCVEEYASDNTFTMFTDNTRGRSSGVVNGFAHTDPTAIECSHVPGYVSSVYWSTVTGCIEHTNGNVYFNAKYSPVQCGTGGIQCVRPKKSCPAGTYDSDGLLETPCVECSPGSVTDTLDQPGATQCTPCEQGTYNTDSKTACIEWSENRESCMNKENDDGQLGNRYSPGTTTTDATCTPCFTGYTAPLSLSDLEPTSCSLCSGGYGGKVQPDSSITCELCQAGEFQVHGSLLETPCADKECPRGQGVTDDDDKILPCQDCSVNTFSNSSVDGQCETCTGHKFTAGDDDNYLELKATQCLNCPAGKHQNPLHGECEDCPVGKTSNAGGPCDIYVPLCQDQESDDYVVAGIEDPAVDNTLCTYTNKMEVGLGLTGWGQKSLDSAKATDFKSSGQDVSKEQKQKERKTKMRALLKKVPGNEKTVEIDLKNIDIAQTFKRAYDASTKLKVVRPANVGSEDVNDFQGDAIPLDTFSETEPFYVPLEYGEGVKLHVKGIDLVLLKVSDAVKVKTGNAAPVQIGEGEQALITEVDPHIVIRYGSVTGEIGIAGCGDNTALNYLPTADYFDNTLCRYDLESDGNIIVQRSDPGQVDETQWQVICESGEFLHNFGDRLECTQCDKTVFRISYLSDNVNGVTDSNLKHYRCCSFLSQSVCMKMLSTYKEACESTLCPA